MSGFLRSLAARGAGLGQPTQPRAMSAAVELGVPPSDLGAREPAGEDAAVVTFLAERPEVGAPPVLGRPGKLVSAAPTVGEQPAGGEAEHSDAVFPPRPDPTAPADPAPLREPVEIDDASPSAAAATPAASPAAAARSDPPRSHGPVDAASPPAPVPAESAVAHGVALHPDAPRAAAAVATSHTKVSAAARVVDGTGESLAAPVRSPSPAPASTGPTASPARATPVPEPSIEVRIGRLEVRAPRPPEPQPSAPRTPERGFDDLALARRGLERRWY